MKQKKICAVFLAAVTGASLLMSSTAMAREDTISIPYQQESAWDGIAMANDDTVFTGVNIHSAADQDSSVIGYLYQGGAVWVINKGEKWTEIYSGGLTGFVMNDYLVYGAEATGLAQYYGTEGVATTWDDVKLFESGSGGSEVLDSLDSGASFVLTEDGGDWLQVQSSADSTAYVSAEDVSRVLLLSTAVAVDAEDTSAYFEDADTYYEEAETAEAYTQDVSCDAPAAYAGETCYEDTSYTEETTYYTETETETASTSSSGLPGGIGYYDEYTGTYYDYYGNAVYTGAAVFGYYDEYTGDYYDIYGNWMFNIPLNYYTSDSAAITTSSSAAETASADTSAYTETTTTTAAETETAETEASDTTTTSASVSSDDATLLAALIYCEAGNQSYEGMVAVGAVVMNRVASSSFPNTIYDVIYESGQFTPAYSGALASAMASGVPSTCYDAAVAAMNGENPVGSALYFNTGSGKGIKIGAHQFY